MQNRLSLHTDVDLTKYKPCHYSQTLLAKYHPLLLQDYVPISVYGDGNFGAYLSVCTGARSITRSYEHEKHWRK